MLSHKETLSEDIFIKELDKRKQAKIQESVLAFLRKRRSVDGNGYTTEKIAKETGLRVHSVGFVLKTGLFYKKWDEWVEHKGFDYFRATSSSSSGQ